ncbi:hypothetical protein [Burkholderia multivorans]|nr:hypothetical protein [Burkholderia multivorans]
MEIESLKMVIWGIGFSLGGAATPGADVRRDGVASAASAGFHYKS